MKEWIVAMMGGKLIFQASQRYTREEIEMAKACLENHAFMSMIRKAVISEKLQEAAAMRDAVAAMNWHSAALAEGRMQAIEDLERLLANIATLDPSERS